MQRQVSDLRACADAVLKQGLKPGGLQGGPALIGQGRGQRSAGAARHASARSNERLQSGSWWSARRCKRWTHGGEWEGLMERRRGIQGECIQR